MERPHTDSCPALPPSSQAAQPCVHLRSITSSSVHPRNVTIMGRHKKATVQHRQRAAAAAVLRPPAHYDSDSELEDEEAAEFRREAAELLRQKQQQTALTGGLTQARLDQAARMMAVQMGVDRRLAEDALLATAEQHCQDPDE